MRPRKKLFEAHYSKSGNGKKHWFSIGRPHGMRESKWFATEAEAKAEVKKSNSELND